MFALSRLAEKICKKLVEAQLTLDLTDAPLEIERDQIERFYLPLAKALASRISSAERHLVAVAGPPGSGKSAFALLLCAVINILLEEEIAIWIGLDGWHFPNAYLESHFVERDGKKMSLRSLKGSPESFDALSALSCLQLIRQGQEVSFPLYSRALHDPLPGAGRVLASHRLILVEGNFLLLDEPPWNRFQEVFHTGIFIRASHQVCLAGLLERHRRVGKDEAEIQRQIDRVDLPNVERILSASRASEFIVEKEDSRRICRITRWGEVFAA